MGNETNNARWAPHELARREILRIEYDTDHLVVTQQRTGVEVRTDVLPRTWLSAYGAFKNTCERLQPVIASLPKEGAAHRWLVVSESLSEPELEPVLIATLQLLEGFRVESCRHDCLERALRNAERSARMHVWRDGRPNVVFVIEFASLIKDQLPDANKIVEGVTNAQFPLVTTEAPLPEDCQIVIEIGERSPLWFDSLRRRIKNGEYLHKHVALLSCTTVWEVAEIADEMLDSGAVAAIQFRGVSRFAAFVPLVYQAILDIRAAPRVGHIDGDLLIEQAMTALLEKAASK